MKENTDISERILQVIDYYNINKNQFAAKLGYNRSQTIYDIISNKVKPSYEFFRMFALSEYSVLISIQWLISGEGDMLIDHKSNVSVVSKTTEETLLTILKEKDAKIEAQAIRIGRLEAEVEILRKKSTDREDAVDVECVGAVG